MSSEKDCWDKFEIVSRAFGVIVIPLAIGGAAYFLNAENAKRQDADAKLRLAFDIVDRPPVGGAADAEIRKWALEVISNPGQAPSLPAVVQEELEGSELQRKAMKIAQRAGSAAAFCEGGLERNRDFAKALVGLERSPEVEDVLRQGVLMIELIKILCEDDWALHGTASEVGGGN